MALDLVRMAPRYSVARRQVYRSSNDLGRLDGNIGMPSGEDAEGCNNPLFGRLRCERALFRLPASRGRCAKSLKRIPI